MPMSWKCGMARPDAALYSINHGFHGHNGRDYRQHGYHGNYRNNGYLPSALQEQRHVGLYQLRMYLLLSLGWN